MVVSRGWGGGRGNGTCRLKGGEFQFSRMKKVLERNVGDGCTECLRTVHFIMFGMTRVMCCVFYHSF